MIERLDFGSGSQYNATEASIHLARYLAAKPFIAGKKVLDVACGEGYGSYLMRCWGAKTVYGVDVDEVTVRKASKMFSDENLTYFSGTAEKLPFEEYSFDTIVSFETIEHLDEPERFLSEIKRLLKPGGTVLLSCPNDYYYYENTPVDNPFHKHKYHFFDFKEVAEKYLGKATKYYLGFATDGFLTIPIENSTFPEDQAALDTMLELFHYRLSENVALLKQERLINHWNSNYYIGLWTSDFNAEAISAAIYPRETFLKLEDFDLNFYRDVRMKLQQDEEKKDMENQAVRTELELLKEENEQMKEQLASMKESELQNITELEEKIKSEQTVKTELELLKEEYEQMKEQLASMKEHEIQQEMEQKRRAKSEQAVLKTENERLKMMLEFANKEIAVLYNTIPTKAAETEVHYITVDETVESNLVSQLNYYKSECNRYENSTCWKITKPLRIIMDFLKKIFH